MPPFLCKQRFSISMGSREKSSRKRRGELAKEHGLDITNPRDRRKIATLMQQQKKRENSEIWMKDIRSNIH